MRHQCAHNASVFLAISVCYGTRHHCYFVRLLQKCPDIIRGHGAFTFQISSEPKTSLRHLQKSSQNSKDRTERKLREAKGTFEGKFKLSEFLIIIFIHLWNRWEDTFNNTERIFSFITCLLSHKRILLPLASQGFCRTDPWLSGTRRIHVSCKYALHPVSTGGQHLLCMTCK